MWTNHPILRPDEAQKKEASEQFDIDQKWNLPCVYRISA